MEHMEVMMEHMRITALSHLDFIYGRLYTRTHINVGVSLLEVE